MPPVRRAGRPGERAATGRALVLPVRARLCSTTAVASSWTLEFPYRRSVGPVIGAFLAGLRDRTVIGAKTASGRVIVPPLEYDPETGDDIVATVEVAPRGVVEGHAWVGEPMRTHPLDRPFAWVLVRLDGADTAMVHALDAASPGAVSEGMRVQIRWAGETQGHINDIVCFEPEGV